MKKSNTLARRVRTLFLALGVLVFLLAPAARAEEEAEGYPENVVDAIGKGQYANAANRLVLSQQKMDRNAKQALGAALEMLADKPIAAPHDRTYRAPRRLAWSRLAAPLRNVIEILADVAKSRKSRARLAHARRCLAVALFRSQDLPAALEALEGTEALASGRRDQATSLCFRAWLQFQNGDATGAKKTLGKARKKNRRSKYLKKYKRAIAAGAKFESRSQTKETDHFVIVYPETEEAILLPLLENVLETSFARLSERFGRAPKRKLVVQIYSRPKDYAAVNGLPRGFDPYASLDASILKGNVLRFCSPRSARLPNTLPGYTGTLWSWTIEHHLIYHFLRTQTHGSIPDWFLEGSALYFETRKPNNDLSSAAAWMAHFRTFLGPAAIARPLHEIPMGERPFFRAQTRLIVQYVVEKKGTKVYQAMLEGFAAGKSSSDVIRDNLEKNPRKFFDKTLLFARSIKHAYDTSHRLFEWNMVAMPALVAWEARKHGPVTAKSLDKTAQELLKRKEPEIGKDGKPVPPKVGEAPPKKTLVPREAKYAIACHLGLNLLRRGKWKDAISMLQKAKTFRDKPIAAALLLGYTHRRNGDAKAAVEELSAALKRAPTHLLLLAELGRAALAAGDLDTARVHLEAAQSRAPWLPIVSQKLAEIYFTKGDKVTALKYLNAQLQVFPYDPQTWKLITKCTEDKALIARAEAALEVLETGAKEPKKRRTPKGNGGRTG